MSPVRFLAPLALMLAPAALWAQPSASPHLSAARYDAMGRVTGTISPNPTSGEPLPFLAVRSTYDAAGRLIKVENGSLSAWQSEAVAPAAWANFSVYQSVETAYDAMGRRIRETLREGTAGPIRAVTQFSYDAMSRLECTAVRMNADTFAAPPASACTPATASPDYGPDRITKTIYDAAGQRLQAREAVGVAGVEATDATWAYNANGQVTTVVDGNGNRAELRYDGHGRQDRWTFPSTTGPAAFDDSTPALALSTAGSVNAADYEAYEYDPGGNRTRLRKRDGRHIVYDHDRLNRVTSRAYPDGGARAVFYSYDLRGLQISARFDSQSGEGVTQSFDGFGRLASQSISLNATTRTLSYQYDRNGNRTRITHPDGNYFRTWYDPINRPYHIDISAGAGIAFTHYAPHGGPWVVNRENYSSTAFAFDGVQRPSVIAHNFASPGNSANVFWTFGRNPASQLTAVTRSNDLYAWTGHQNVNRPYVTNGLNQYTTAGPSFTYDANGNLVTDGSTTFSYDIENRLVGASGLSNGAIEYDPLGRIFRYTGGSGGSAVTTFLYDGDALVAEYNASGTMTRRYVHNAGVDVPMVQFPDAAFAAPFYLHADERGSIVALSPASGAPAINAYDEYGIPMTPLNGRFGYTGQIWLPEIGLYHYKARAYSPTLGRFMQTDPIGYDDQFNLYAYVGNDPVNASDPEGTQQHTAGPRIWRATPPTVRNAIADVVEVIGVGWDIATIWTGIGSGPEGIVVTQGISRAIRQGVRRDTRRATERAAERAGTNTSRQRPAEFTRATKREVRRESPNCEGCGQPTIHGQADRRGVRPPDNRSEIHHKDAASQGGSRERSNAQNLCRRCHIERHRRD